MAELLLYNRTDPDSGASGYDTGDVVDIKPDGHQWGTEELKTEKFLVLAIVGESVENLKHLLEEHVDEGDLDADGDARVLNRRHHRFDSVRLTPNLKRRLEREGRLELTRVTLDPLLEDKSTR